MRSRLSRSVEQKTKKRLYLTILGTIVLLFLLLKYGIPLLVNFSLILGNTKNTPSISGKKGNQFIAVPTFNDIVQATNSATIAVSGTAGTNQDIKLFVNGRFTDTVKTKNDGSFEFRDVSLQQGNNTLKAKATAADSGDSDFTDPMQVVYKNSPPALTIDQPSDNQAFSKDQSSITVSGKTDPDVKITVNDFWAIVSGNGSYSYSLHLQNGDNQIKVVASDNAGNKTEKSIKVTYSP